MAAADWFEIQARASTSMRLFCIPHAGGSAYAYRNWPQHVPATVSVVGVRLPGRGPRILEQPYRRMEPLVAALSEAMTPYLDLPFAIFGHSMGAMIAFEVCAQLRQRGFKAAHLFVSGTSPPHIRKGHRDLHALPRAEFLGEIGKLNGTAAEILEEESVMATFLPILRADFELVETYPVRACPPVDCALTAFGGRNDPTVSEQQIGEWAPYTTSAFRRRMFDGDHFFVAAHEATVLAELSVALNAA